MFFEVQGRILFANDNFQGTFVGFYLELPRIFIRVRNIFNCWGLSKCCYQSTLQLLRKNFEYSRDQVTFRVALFLTLVPNKKQKCRYGMPWHLHTIQKLGLHKIWEYYYFSIISPCFGKGKHFPDNSNLINLVDIQR